MSCQVLIGEVVCSEQKISVRADVVAPYSHLSATELDIGVTYLNVAVERTVKIHNLTQLPSHYSWLPEDLLSEEDTEKVQILVSPQRVQSVRAKRRNLTLRSSPLPRVTPM